jgi:hypothetical protein
VAVDEATPIRIGQKGDGPSHVLGCGEVDLHSIFLQIPIFHSAHHRQKERTWSVEDATMVQYIKGKRALGWPHFKESTVRRRRKIRQAKALQDAHRHGRVEAEEHHG